ncbi:hypothetical protein [Cyanobium sp. Morenito 9A2]|uniref:hypothetical protein n=1 Tax=Cyanobium sp. Morenito 9A2 TaxID=2823718 RepID=UPI0020CD03EC|nr:hypothetical protein [Cyanobium sp. Morenito 9A2]MCP9850284.1 hypothetical protein [Cyanobium sp. Morenito 9A2]
MAIRLALMSGVVDRRFMFRWLLLGLLLVGVGVALDKQWVVANWDRVARDLKLPDSNWTQDIYKTKEQADTPPPGQYKSFRDLIKAE